MSTTVTFTANDTWIVPAGVTSLKIECWSGGSGGQNKDPGNGGLGGCYARGNAVAVTPSETLTVLVGAGGGGLGTAGGPSSVKRGGSTLVEAYTSQPYSTGDVKWAGGGGGSKGSGGGGGGGSSAGTDASGNAGFPGVGDVGGAGGVPPAGGWTGGRGGDNGSSGSDAPSYAGGGGGAGDGDGGFGGDGIVKITYEEPATGNRRRRLLIAGVRR